MWRKLAPVLVSLAVLACGPKGSNTRIRRGQVTGVSFEFMGGNDAEWNVKLRGDAFWVAREREGKIDEFGPWKLSQDEADRAWELIDEAEIPKRKSSKRQAADEDERLYMFVVAPKESGLRDVKVPIVEVWADDVYEDEQLANLVRYLGKLIQKYTKKKALL